MRLTLLTGSAIAPVGVLAQVPPSDGWGILASYGVAAPFALLCLWIIHRQGKDLETTRADLASATQVGMEKVVPALERSSATVTEATKAVESATVMMHNLAGRTLSAEHVYELIRLLGVIERRLGGT